MVIQIYCYLSRGYHNSQIEYTLHLHFSVFGLRTVLIKQSAVHIYFKLMFHIK